MRRTLALLVVSLAILTGGALGHGTNVDYHGGNDEDSNPMDENILGDEQSKDDTSAMTMIQPKPKSAKIEWRAHGILAFLAWGVFAPLAISAAVLRDLDLAPLWNKLLCCEDVEEKYLFKSFLAKFWLYTHIGLNSLNYVFTVVAFSIAVNTFSREMHSHFDHAHSQIGLTIIVLMSFHVIGGFLRPSKEKKSTLRTTWESIHHLLGVTLFVLGVYQLYTGLSYYNDRYGEVSTVLYVVMGLLVFLWSFIILGGSFYKLILFVNGSNEEKNVKDADEEGGKDSKTNGDVLASTKKSEDDLKFEDEEVVVSGA